MNLTGDPAAIGNWKEVQVSELVAPNRMRWDMTIPGGSKWQVLFDGTKTNSGGDKKKYGRIPFAQELESSIRVFSMMRLPLVLSQILDKFDIKKGPDLVLVADSRDDRFTFQLNADFSLFKLLHETSPRQFPGRNWNSDNINRSDRTSSCRSVILRYPDRPKHEHVFQYDKIEPDTQMKEEQFKR